MTCCIQPACTRRRLPHRNRCESCYRVLLAAIFGPADPGAAA